jgi:predicted glycogen debranching enzyme
MSYLNFDKTQLINLSYSLERELIRSNRAGSYSCTTIIASNTRKYHGLLVVPLEQLDGGYHVLLSSLDETVIQHQQEFNLGVHKFPGDYYNPKGHKYVRDFTADLIPKITYRVGGVILTKEMLLIEKEERMLIKYTLVEAQSPTKLRFKPFLAFRNIHALSKANMDVIGKSIKVKNGIKTRMYHGYPYLFMQFSKQADYVSSPDWHYNIEYFKEQRRGYEFQEDLYVPGFFELPIKKGESVIFSAGLSEADPVGLKRKFDSEANKRTPRNTFKNCLVNSAHQFIYRKDKKTDVIAGYPWYGPRCRDTFIALPGLTLAIGDEKTCLDVLRTMSKKLEGALFPDCRQNGKINFDAADIPLWFFWSLQQYANYTGNYPAVWKEFGKKMKHILSCYRCGIGSHIQMHENGLIWASEPGKALTWMNAYVDGKPVTQRNGYAVEINLLWYNAVQFALELAGHANDRVFVKEWSQTSGLIKDSFLEKFWNEDRGYLADVVNEEGIDDRVRPNMVFAASFHYSPLNIDQQKLLLDKITEELLTPRGLRTLGPNEKLYKGIYFGNQSDRDYALFNGTAWPWLLGHYVEGLLKVFRKSTIDKVKSIYYGFEEEIKIHGIGTISEVYDGDPPHKAGGAISMAVNVGELLRLRRMYRNFAEIS